MDVARTQPSSSERPGRHEWELAPPERAAVRSLPFGHHDVRPCRTQRLRPAGRVLQEKRLLRSGNEIGAGKPPRHRAGRSVAAAWRGAEYRAVDVRMAKPHGESQLSTRRDAEHRGAFFGRVDAEARPRPLADVLDEERLVACESIRVEAWRVLMEPQRLVGQAVDADDHRRWSAGGGDDIAPRRDQLTIA